MVMGEGSKKFFGNVLCICSNRYIYIYKSLIRFLRFILKTNRSLISAQCKFITVLKTNIKKRGKSVEV